MMMFQMTIDTVFLCFCEDCEQNDGISKPYYMSRDLMVFVENSKKALEFYDAQQRGGPKRNAVTTISGSIDEKL